MRRNSCTVVVLASPAPGEVLAAIDRSMNVALIRSEDPDPDGGDAIQRGAAALQRAGRSSSAYALVAADPLAAAAAGWQAMWDVTRPQGPEGFELAAAQTLAAWRAGRFELPDYYLVLAADTGSARTGSARTGSARTGSARTGSARTGPVGTGQAGTGQAGTGQAGTGQAGTGPVGTGQVGTRPDTRPGGGHGPDFYLGPLRSARPHRVVFVPATEPAAQAAGVLQALGSLRHGPWWPPLDEVIEVARRFYPDSLAEGRPALAAGPI